MGKRSLAANNVFFPEEILLEIFSYVEAKYLLRCKYVCKLWYAVIKSKPLVEMQLMRNGHRYYDLYTAGKSPHGIAVYIRFKSYRCRGLVLSSLSVASLPVTYHISNPTTNCSINIPHPHKGMKSIHLFLNTCTGSYNVLSVYFDEVKKTRHIELLDLGGQSNDPCPNTDLSWRTLNISEFEVSTHPSYLSKYCMAPEGSILYVITSPYLESTKFNITCVDLVMLTCTYLEISVNVCLYWGYYGFQFWRGKPSIVFISENKLNIMVLEDYKTQKWADTVVFPLLFMKKPYWKIHFPILHTDGREDMLVIGKELNSPPCTVYKLQSQVRCHIPSLPRKVQATLVSVKGMQPQKKEFQIKLDMGCI